MVKTIIGLMGPGSGAKPQDLETAERLGNLIASEGWVLLTGGRDIGVMQAASKGASEASGLTIGILPDSDKSRMSEFIDIPIVTGMGSARNNINVLSSDVVVAVGTGKGTASEIMLALKAGKQVVLINQSESLTAFVIELDTESVHFISSPSEVISKIKTLL